MAKKTGSPNHLLRAARKERGWTQKDVADRIGAPLSLNVTRWELGTAFPSAHYVGKLCLLFGQSAKELGLVQDENPEASEAVADSATIVLNELSFPPPTSTGRIPFLPNRVLRISLALLTVIAISGLLSLLYINWNAAHRVAAVPVRVISAVDAESTARVAPTATLIATYPDPYPSRSGKLAFYDVLNTPYLWSKGVDDKAGRICQFADNAYHVSESLAANAGMCFSQDFDGSNFAVEVQMEVIQGDCGGFIVRSNEPDDYQFTVCQNGYYVFTRYQGSSNYSVLVNKNSPTIVVGLNRLNVIAVVADGSTFDLYVNRHKIDTIHDSAYSHGQIGLIANNDTSTFTEVIYKHAKIWTW